MLSATEVHRETRAAPQAETVGAVEASPAAATPAAEAAVEAEAPGKCLRRTIR